LFGDGELGPQEEKAQMRKTRSSQAGFTLMELMVVIVIVAILAAVAVPLYINYVKDAQRTEAKGAIGAIISAQQVFYQKSSLAGAPNYADNLQELKDSGALDLTEVEGKWEFEVTSPGDDQFTVRAENLANADLVVRYVYDRATGGAFSDGDAPPAP
jgi:type IV pilus assembly protein PilE